jgi:transcription elongation factor Elf1
MTLIWDYLFGCTHANTSRVFTVRLKKWPRTVKRTYVCCLDCGQEFSYDWQNMRIAKESPREGKRIFALEGK